MKALCPSVEECQGQAASLGGFRSGRGRRGNRGFSEEAFSNQAERAARRDEAGGFHAARIPSHA